MEAPRMNRLRETVAPPSRPLLQITGRALQVAEEPGELRLPDQASL